MPRQLVVVQILNPNPPRRRHLQRLLEGARWVGLRCPPLEGQSRPQSLDLVELVQRKVLV